MFLEMLSSLAAEMCTRTNGRNSALAMDFMTWSVFRTGSWLNAVTGGDRLGSPHSLQARPFPRETVRLSTLLHLMPILIMCEASRYLSHMSRYGA